MTNPIKMEVMEHVVPLPFSKVAKNEYKCYKYMKDNSTIFFIRHHNELSLIIIHYKKL